MFRLLLRSPLRFSFIVSFILSFSLAAHADFKGLWLSAGAKSLTEDKSSADIDYTSSNRFGGSYAYPGYIAVGSYHLEAENADGESKIPTMKLMYLTPMGGGWLGISVSADAYSERHVASQKFDLTSPTNVADYPYGFKMTTVLEPTMGLQVSLEPGVLLFPSLMAFIKMTYNKLNIDIKTQGQMDRGLGVTTFSNTATSYSFEGMGGGFGLRYLLTENILIEPLIEFVDFKPQTITTATLNSPGDEYTLTQRQEMKLKWGLVSLSLGYQF